MNRLQRAYRRRRDGQPADQGFALVFVMLVVMVATIAVTALLTVTTPDLARARNDAGGAAAGAAARSAIDDFVAYVSGIDICRSTTRVCDQALGADSSSAGRTLNGVKPPVTCTGAAFGTTGPQQSFLWCTESQLTSDGNVRVHATGYYGSSSRTLVADIALAPSILSFGYYSDYESQSPDYLVQQYPTRAVRVDSQNYWQYITLTNVKQATTASWTGVTANSAQYCGRHWWTDGSTSGRASTGSNFSENVSLSGYSGSASRTSTCDVVFTTGQTFDGPVYTRDALYISDATSGGDGPRFQSGVVTGWGYGDHVNPAPAGDPWRKDPNVGGELRVSPNKPTISRFDLQLPTNIGSEGLATNACVYQGPTRVVLNGDGTATVTSPRTTAKNSASDPKCYPTTVGSTGIAQYTFDYRSVGGGTILARNIGTEPAAGWATTGIRSTDSAVTANNAVFYVTSPGGTTSPDKPNTSAAPDSCGTYSAAVNAACAWQSQWKTTSSSSTACTTSGAGSSIASTDRIAFDCDYNAANGGSVTKNVPQYNYDTFRSIAKSYLAGGVCLTGTTTDQAGCLKSALQGVLPADTATRRYVVYASTGSSSTGSAVNVGTTPTSPYANDGIFTSTTGTAATEKPTYTPITLSVVRNTRANSTAAWSADTAQFTFTVTETGWAIASTGTVTSYFPNLSDVTQYDVSAGSNVAGDLYVEGTNTGKLSLLADNDIVVTDDITDKSSDPDTDAVNLVAGGNVRNYNPVSCLSTAATASIQATSPGFCPNDLTGLTSYSLTNNGSNPSLTAQHPASQYVNLQPTGDRRIDAAVFALTGSLLTDNYNRGKFMGTLQVNGGLYQSHRGANGMNIGAGSGVVRLGFSLSYHYVDLRKADLPYEPTARMKSGRVWTVVTVNGSGPS